MLAAIFFIWKERNGRIFKGKNRKLVHVFVDISTAVIARISKVRRMENIVVNRELAQKWQLSEEIFTRLTTL